MILAPGYSSINPPVHWNCHNGIPPHWLDATYAWCLNSSTSVTSQCGQSEVLSALIRTQPSINLTYLDIGANDGHTNSSTLLLSQNGWMGVCIEPNTKHLSSLSDRPNTIPISAAIGDSDSLVEFLSSSSLDVLSCVKGRDIRQEQRLYSESLKNDDKVVSSFVLQISLDTLWRAVYQGHPELLPTFIKIDVEGSEEVIVNQLSSLRLKSTVFIEIENNYRTIQCAQMLEALDFKCLIVFDSFVELWCYNTIYAHSAQLLPSIISDILS